MKRLTMLTASVLVVGAGGCTEPKPTPDQYPAVNSWLINSVQDTSINQAIITQGTVFPYHFAQRTATLNELGRHDLKVLAGHYRRHPGELSIRRGKATVDLYQARVDRVLETLTRAGVERRRMEISDARAGGEGMSSERVLKVFEGESDKSPLLSSGGGS